MHREDGKAVSVTVVICSGSGNSLAMGPMNNSLCVVSLLSDAKPQHFTKTTSSWGNFKCTPPHLSEVSLTLPLKRFQCSSD